MNDPKTIYLCGPIAGCTDSEANDWRTLIKGWARGRSVRDSVDLGKFVQRPLLQCLDPMDRDYRGCEYSKYREIVDLDKVDVRASDVVLVNYTKPSVGTSMEVFYAWTLGKPIIIWCDPDVDLSPWLCYHSTTIVHTVEEVYAALVTFTGIAR